MGIDGYPRRNSGMAKRDVQSRFGRRVRELRKQKGLTQEQLAEAIGRSVDTVSNIERGSSLTRISTVAAIADVLGVSMSGMFESADDQLMAERDRSKARRLARLIETARSLDAAALDALTEIAKVVHSIRRS